jgi:hypothetical protein
MLTFGLIAASLLTFGAVFLVAVSVIAAAWEAVVLRRWRVAVATTAAIAALAAVLATLHWCFGYDHVRAFVTASRIENPQGYRALAEPLAFLMTRIEGFWEIVLFASIGVAAVAADRWRRRRLPGGDCPGRVRNDVGAWLACAGLLTLVAMFAAGAYRTGETARACLFIYPYLLLSIRGVRGPALDGLIAVAAVQTAIMQTFGGYRW